MTGLASERRYNTVMKLHHTTASPYVRKVDVTAIEAGLNDEIERVTPTGSVWIGDSPSELVADNPLAKIPTLITREGERMIESTLICEYLASLNPAAGLLPPVGPEHWRIRNEQALAQGLMDCIVLHLVEGMMRAPERRSEIVMARLTERTHRVLDYFEGTAQAGVLDDRASRVDLATITLACSIGFSAERWRNQSWREGRPALSNWYDAFCQRPSMQATVPPEAPINDARQGQL